MTRIKTIGLALLAVFAFSAIAATAAQAEEAPYWSIEGTRLAAGKTFEILAKANGNQTLTASTGQVITCTAFSLKPGAVLLGSNAGEPGKSDETIKYTGCTVSGNGTSCAVENGTVETKPLTNELAYASNKKSLVVEFVPVTGKVLAEFKFTGTCTLTTTKVTGVAVAGAFTDATTPVLLELPTAVTPAESFLLKLTNTSTEKIWLIKGGTGTEVETEEINSFGAGSKLAGTALILLGVHGTSVTTKWSPLL